MPSVSCFRPLAGFCFPAHALVLSDIKRTRSFVGALPTCQGRTSVVATPTKSLASGVEVPSREMAESPRRCGWVASARELEVIYHDEEWGMPPLNDQKHFEMLCLEGAQAGLSWATILAKREGYRTAFHHFDPRACVGMTDEYLASVVAGKKGDVVKHKGKVLSVRSNAAVFLQIVSEHGSFDDFLREIFEGATLEVHRKSKSEIPVETEEARTLSSELKKRGFKFFGPKIAYAYMQATGIVTDHETSCFCFDRCLEAHRAWRRG